MQPERFLFTLAAAALLMSSCSGGNPQPSQAVSGQPSATQTTATSTGSGSASPTSAALSAAAPAGKTPSSGNTGSGVATGALERVSMPSGTRYDPWKGYKIGDAIDLPVSGLVAQVISAKTVDFEADRDLLLVDLILGNKNKEKYTVSSVLLMDAVTNDWHWYSLGLDELMKVSTKIAALNIKTFDTDLEPNQAMKGTAVIPVPKNAEGLAFAFNPLNPVNPIEDSDPVLYVSLGIKGDFKAPWIPENAPEASAGTAYRIGQPVKLAKRGVIAQVNGVRERTQSLPELKVNVEDKFVIVDVSMRLLGDAKGLTAQQEVSLVDSDGNSFRTATGDSTAVANGEQTRTFDPAYRRGVLVFMTDRDSKGFSLKIRPADPSSTLMKPSYLEDETVLFDLGGSPAQAAAPAKAGPTVAPTRPAAPGATAAPTKPAAAATAVPEVKPIEAPAPTAVAPKLVDPSVLAPELKSVPIPPGFGVVDRTARRVASGGTFSSAGVQLWGRKSVKEVADFYAIALAAEWENNYEDITQEYIDLEYINKKDDNRELFIDGEETDEGTTINVRVAD